MPLARLLSRPVTLDAGLALLLVAASLALGRDILLATGTLRLKAIAMLGSPEAFQEHMSWWWTGTALAAVALPFRSRLPAVAIAVSGAAVLVHVTDIRLQQAGLPLLPVDLIAAMTLYTLTSVARSRRTGLIALGGAIALLYFAVLAAVLANPHPGLEARAAMLADAMGTPVSRAASLALLPALLLGIAWAVGDATRTHRIHRAASEQRAADAQREQEQRAALAVAAERARISRELHDVVAHGISVMVVQAQAAEAALDNEPGTSRVAIGHVIDTGRASLAEMRRVLSVIRTEPGLAPPPGVNALPALIDQVRVAGTPVSLVIDGEPVGLPAAVDLSAYRIVQEALTNIRRHAGAGAYATVRLAYRPDLLEILVADNGTATGATENPKRGNGLHGIVERVSALGGHVDAGPRLGGGFDVRAVLPIGATL